jgi:ankyrin repeat protein
MDSLCERAFGAVRAGDLEGLRELLASNSSLASARDGSGLSLLLQACYFKRPEIVDLIISAGPALDIFEAAAMPAAKGHGATLLKANPELASTWSSDGFTPLHLASYFGSTEVAALLIQCGADTNAVSRNAMALRPLHSATASRSLEIAALLLTHGAEVDAKQHGGWTALHAAAGSGDGQLVELLLAHGADPELTNDQGTRAIDAAVERGHPAIADLLRNPKAS